MQVTDDMRKAVSEEMVQWAHLNLSWENSSRFIGSIVMVLSATSEAAKLAAPGPINSAGT